METININEYSIGSGLDFPIKLSTPLDSEGNPIQIQDENGNNVNLVTCKPLVGSFDLIKQNVLAILRTPLGFQLRNEFFGCRLHELIEEQNNQAIEFLLRDYIKSAITLWESRILIQKIITSSYNEIITISINCVLKDSGQENNLELNYNTLNNFIYVNE